MIHTNRTVTISEKQSIIDNPIILYRGDREIEVEFTIIGNRYTFNKDGNVIKSTNASFGQLVILTPYGGRLFSDITECEDGKVTLLIKKEMTDDLIEVGFYLMQIRLFDDNRIARITLPPINNGLDIREPIAAEEGSDVIGDAIVDTSVIEDAKDYGGVDPFIGNQYNIKRWKAGDGITAPQMNKIERAIDTLNENRIIDERKIDQTMTTNNQQSNDINELKTDMNVVERRIDTLMRLEDGSTTGDAELIDARIGYDSNEYDTLGDSMRQQITDVHHAIDLICGSNVKIELNWTDGGYIDKTNGSIIVYDSWKYTDYIELPENVKGLNINFQGLAQTTYNAFYDVNNNFIEYFDVSNENIDIPENAKFFRLSIQKDDSVVVYNRYDELNNKCNPDEVIAISSELDNKLIDDYIGLSKDAYDIKWISDGYIDDKTGEIVYLEFNWKYTDFIKISENAKELEAVTTLTGSYSYNAFYDSNKAFISSFSVKDTHIKIPDNAVYFRLSVDRGSTTNIRNVVEKLIDKCTLQEANELNNKLNNKLIDDYIGLSKDTYDIKWIPDGYIDDKTGEIVYLEFNWKYTDYIKISENAKELEAVTTLTDSYGCNAFYDSNKAFISSFSVKDTRVEIPENAVYFRLSVDRAFTTEIYNAIDKLVDKCTIQEANELNNKLNNKLIDDYIGLSKDAYDIKWITDGYIDDKTGEMVYLEFNWKYTDFIKISENAKELEAVTTLTGSYSYNAFYDSNKAFISSFSVKDTHIKIPDNAVYFRLSVDRASTTEIYNVIEKLVDRCTIQEVSVFVEDKSDELLNMYIGYKYPFKWFGDGYIDNKTGEMVYFDFYWKYTDFINITNKTEYLDVYTTLTGSYSYNAFYDSNKAFISSFSVKDRHVKIPDNAAYFRLSADRASTTSVYDSKYTGESGNPINSSDIVYLNKDVEPFVIQASEGLGRQFPTKNAVLTFAHFSDIHTRQNLWDRIMKYVNHYSSYINFVIHTGDYVGANQASYSDLYGSGIACVKPVYNVVGNHDTMDVDNVYKSDKAHVKSLLFNHMDNWNVTFMELDNSMTYYKDFDDSKIRMIVLDYYYDIDAQCTWLTERLNEAKNLGYHVVTFMHEMTHPITDKLDTTFQTIDDFESLGGNVYSKSKFDAVIGTWIQSGGVHIANFAGHEHSDFIGYTDNGVLNICVQTATNDTIWTDAKRVSGTKTYDCFNVVAIETTTGVLKLVRVGNNSDHYLREKKVFTYDYINKKILTK